MLVELVYSTKNMSDAVVRFDTGKAMLAISKMEEMCDTMISTFGSISVPENAGKYGIDDYFTKLSEYVKDALKDAETEFEGARNYIKDIDAVDDKTVPDADPNKRSNGGPGGPGGPGNPDKPDKKGDFERPEQMSDESYEKTVAAMDKAEDMKKSKKMTDKTYQKTINAITAAIALLKANKISDKTYMGSIDSLDQAMDLLKAGKISEETYSKIVDEMKRAMSLVNSGKMSEDAYAKTISSIDAAMDAIAKDKMTEAQFNKMLDSTDETMSSLALNKMDGETYGKAMDHLSDAANALTEGKINGETYDKALGTYDNALKGLANRRIDSATYAATIDSMNASLKGLTSGKMSETAYNAAMDQLNSMIDGLNSRTISAEAYGAAVTTLNDAISKLQAGTITEEEFNTTLEGIKKALATPEDGGGSGTGGGTDPGTGGGTDPGTGGGQPTGEEEGESIGGDLPGMGGTGGTGAGGTAGAAGAAASLKDGLAAAGNGVVDAISKGAAKLASGIIPYNNSASGTSDISTNKASAGIIAAASLAAGGAAAGGGILAGMKLSTLRFTPEDWIALGPDYQAVITKLMKKVGFSEDEIETFKNSRFKIPTSEIKTHSKKIEKALENNPICDEELLKLYGYGMIDANGKVVDYLLFITMVIDGKNAIDEYNMYNIINQSFENVDDADFTYSGISMEEYFDDSNEDFNDDMEVTVQGSNGSMENEELVEDGFTADDESLLSREWLQDIGIDK